MRKSASSCFSIPNYSHSSNLKNMSNSYYETFAQAIIEQAAHDKRSQPWKYSAKPKPAKSNAEEEWYEVASKQTEESLGGRIDVQEHAFPMGEVDVRTNAFPMGDVDVRTNAFPMGELSVRTNAFPI